MIFDIMQHCIATVTGSFNNKDRVRRDQLAEVLPTAEAGAHQASQEGDHKAGEP